MTHRSLRPGSLCRPAQQLSVVLRYGCGSPALCRLLRVRRNVRVCEALPIALHCSVSLPRSSTIGHPSDLCHVMPRLLPLCRPPPQRRCRPDVALHLVCVALKLHSAAASHMLSYSCASYAAGLASPARDEGPVVGHAPGACRDGGHPQVQ
jgi:hypothetical protein